MQSFKNKQHRRRIFSPRLSEGSASKNSAASARRTARSSLPCCGRRFSAEPPGAAPARGSAPRGPTALDNADRQPRRPRRPWRSILLRFIGEPSHGAAALVRAPAPHLVTSPSGGGGGSTRSEKARASLGVKRAPSVADSSATPRELTLPDARSREDPLEATSCLSPRGGAGTRRGRSHLRCVSLGSSASLCVGPSPAQHFRTHTRFCLPGFVAPGGAPARVQGHVMVALPRDGCPRGSRALSATARLPRCPALRGGADLAVTAVSLAAEAQVRCQRD